MLQQSSIKITRGGVPNCDLTWLPTTACVCMVIAFAALTQAFTAPKQTNSIPPAHANVTTFRDMRVVSLPISSSSETPPEDSRPAPSSYVPRSAVAPAWGFSEAGFPVYCVLSDAMEYASSQQSNDAISVLSGDKTIAANLRCARCVSWLLHSYVPQFSGHDLAELCAQRIQAQLTAKRTQIYNLQEQIDELPSGYLYVICLLKSAHSPVGHICFYDPASKSVAGNSGGMWKTQSLETFWPKYQYYYLLGIPEG